MPMNDSLRKSALAAALVAAVGLCWIDRAALAQAAAPSAPAATDPAKPKAAGAANSPGNTAAAPDPAAGSPSGNGDDTDLQDEEAEADAAPDDLHSREQGQTPLEDSFGPTRRERIRAQRQAALEATKYDLHLRSFYLDRDKFDDSQSKAWALGGWTGLKTGYFRDRFAIGGTAYLSVPMYAPSDKDGTLLLKPGQDGYFVLGELYTDIRLNDTSRISLGRKAYDTPYINRNDTRMSPNTFEAYTITGLIPGGPDQAEWRWGAGYVDKIKERNADEFVSMAIDAGAEVKRGVYTAGGNYRLNDFSIGAINYYSDDIINIFYTEARYGFPLSDKSKLNFYGQYTDQRSTGDDLLQGSEFSTDQFGVKAEIGFGPALFSAAYTSTSEDSSMQAPWSGYPGYTSVQVEDFNRAGEDAWMLRAGYNFPGVPGLSMYGLYVDGNDPAGDGNYEKSEADFNLQWTAPAGKLQGLVLRLRYARVQQEDPADSTLDDLRLIVYYDPPGL